MDTAITDFLASIGSEEVTDVEEGKFRGHDTSQDGH